MCHSPCWTQLRLMHFLEARRKLLSCVIVTMLWQRKEWASCAGLSPARCKKFQRFHSELIRAEEQEPPRGSRRGAQPPLHPSSASSPSQGLDAAVLEEVKDPQRRHCCLAIRQHLNTDQTQIYMCTAVQCWQPPSVYIWTVAPNVSIPGAAMFLANTSVFVFFFVLGFWGKAHGSSLAPNWIPAAVERREC